MSAEPYPLAPQTKVSLNETDPVLKYRHDIVSGGLVIYHSDVVKRLPPRDIIKTYGELFSTLSDVEFDFKKIHLIRKVGLTRYYPFSIKGTNLSFIIRIFRTEERALQVPAPVLDEGPVDGLGLTFQILPSLEEVLRTCRIKPHNPAFASDADTSP